MEEVIKVDDCVENIGDYDIPIHNAIIVPKNATNGDMINALFPNAKNIRVDGGYPLNYIIEGEWHRNLKEWWDAPYSSESNNEKDDYYRGAQEEY